MFRRPVMNGNKLDHVINYKVSKIRIVLNFYGNNSLNKKIAFHFDSIQKIKISYDLIFQQSLSSYDAL